MKIALYSIATGEGADAGPSQMFMEEMEAYYANKGSSDTAETMQITTGRSALSTT